MSGLLHSRELQRCEGLMPSVAAVARIQHQQAAAAAADCQNDGGSEGDMGTPME